jgi:uncharacterized RDD family membrane protein YckC
VSQLVTGEAVTLDLSTAGVPSRILATLIDALAQLLLYFVFAILFTVTAGNEATSAALGIVVLLLCGIGYPVVLETLTKGQTLGKLALGLRVVRDDGGPIGFRQAFVRGLIGFFVEKPGLTFGSGALISSLLSQQSKRLGDLAAGTIVVQTRVAQSRHDAVMMPGPLAGWATTLDLSRLPDDLALSARSFLGRFHSLTPAAQEALGGQLTAAMAAVVTPAPPQGVPHWAYLSAVLAERRRRAELQQYARYVAAAAVDAPAAPVPTPPAVPGTEVTDSPFAPPT